MNTFGTGNVCNGQIQIRCSLGTGSNTFGWLEGCIIVRLRKTETAFKYLGEVVTITFEADAESIFSSFVTDKK